MHENVIKSRGRMYALFELFERTRKELAISHSALIRESHVGRGQYFDKYKKGNELTRMLTFE